MMKGVGCMDCENCEKVQSLINAQESLQKYMLKKHSTFIKYQKILRDNRLLANVYINSDGYYPVCGNCHYGDLDDGVGRCPKCGINLDWSEVLLE